MLKSFLLFHADEYIKAGADLVYPVGVLDLKTIKTLRQAINSPINILGSHRTIPLQTMQELGINRVTFGPFIFRSSLKKFVNIVEELGNLGSYDCFGEDTFSFDETLKFLREEKE